MPQTNVATIAQPSEYSTILQSREISSMRGTFLARDRNTAPAPSAKTRPSTLPAIARMNTSASKYEITEPRAAPREKRTAISWRRASARDNRSPATFVQAINISKDTEPKRIQSEFLTPPTVTSLRGETVGEISASGF